MKSSSQQNILILGFSVSVFLNLFRKPLGLPEWSEWLFMSLGLICVVTLLFLQRRARKRRDPDFIPATPSKNRRYTWLLLIVLFFSCLTWPFILPYTGITLPLSQLVVISAVTFIMCAVLVIVVRKRRGLL